MEDLIYEVLKTYYDYDEIVPICIGENIDEQINNFQNIVTNRSGIQVKQTNNKTLDEFEKLKKIIIQCKKCGRYTNKFIPSNFGKYPLMIILNEPELITSIEKKMLKNDAQIMIKKMMKAINVNDYYITNTIKCQFDSILKSKIINNCQHILINEIKIINPQIILVMGDLVSIGAVKKTFNNKRWFKIEHPFTLIKNPDLKRNAWETLKKVGSCLNEKDR